MRLTRLVPRGVRRWLAQSRTWKAATSPFRVLPDFLIIGAQKSGTTALYAYLRQHPRIVPSLKKELHYFSREFHRGELWYRSQFPLIAPFSRRLVFEASPSYMARPDDAVASRIHKRLPHVKLIAILRNPAERAISAYFHHRRNPEFQQPIHEALDPGAADPAVMIRMSRYAELLKPYLERFDRDRLLVLQAEALFANPQQVLDRIFRYLAVESAHVPNLRPVHTGRNRVPVDPAIRERLVDYFQPLSQDLFDLIGESFDWK